MKTHIAINVYMTHAEHERIERAAVAKKLNLSNYVRARLGMKPREVRKAKSPPLYEHEGIRLEQQIAG